MSNVAFAILRSKAVAAGFAFDDCAVRESARRQFPVSLALGLLVIALAAPGAVRPGRKAPAATGLARHQVMAPTFVLSPAAPRPAPVRAVVRIG
ncbi:MAG: hypothetical protein ACLPGW_18845 [Roseiarcus sp.]